MSERAGADRLIALESPQLVVHLVVPVEVVDTERDDAQPEHTERRPRLVELAVDLHELRHRRACLRL
jgi:hypothetical protein